MITDVAASTVWQYRPERYFKDCLKIEDRTTGKLTEFKLNPGQVKIQAAIDKQRKAGKPIRILILKGRQIGVSTLSTANVFHGCRFGGGTAMVVSKDGNSSEHIFGIIQRYYDNLPESEKEALPTKASNRREFKFAHPHGGRIVVDTAGSERGAGHSFTIRHLLLSEVSRWPEGCDDTITGLSNAVHHVIGTSIFIESVANGAQGWFYEQWHKQSSDFEKIFLPWFEYADYKKELPTSEAKYIATLTLDERQLEARHKLTLEQIEWRRWAITNNCQDNPDTFKEQYPSTPDEAFLRSGTGFFSNKWLDSIQTQEPLRGELREGESLTGASEIFFVLNEQGRYLLWKRPQIRREYVMGADVAEGIEIEGAPGGDKHDYSSADVLDRDTGEQVCQLHGKITPDEFGRMLALLGRWYNHAFVGVESNSGYGLHVLDEMQDVDYPLHLIYKQQTLDETTRRPTQKMGWRTTKANRKSLMSSLDMGGRKGEVLVNCAETLRELRAFITKPDGRIEHGSGHKDDRVFSLALGYAMLEVAPAKQGKSSGASAFYEPIRYKHAGMRVHVN